MFCNIYLSCFVGGITVFAEASHRDLPALHVVRDCSEKVEILMKNFFV